MTVDLTWLPRPVAQPGEYQCQDCGEIIPAREVPFLIGRRHPLYGLGIWCGPVVQVSA